MKTIKTIKNNIYLLGMVLVSFPSFSQNSSLKDIERLVRKNQFETARQELKQYVASWDELSDEQKTYYHLLNSQVSVIEYYNATEIDSFLTISIENLNKVEELEVKNKVSKYSKEAQLIKNDLLAHLVNKAIVESNGNAYTQAAKTFLNAYQLSKRDTVFLYQSAGMALNGKDNAFAVDRYKELIGLNYNGKDKVFVATNVFSNTVESFGKDEKIRDQAIKSGVYSNPQTIEENSKKPSIYKNLASILIHQNNFSQGEFYALKAQELNPKDLDLYMMLFHLYMKTDRLFRFQEFKEKALKEFPNTTQLYYNLGVVYYNLGYYDLAKENFELGLKIDPLDYNINKAIGSLLLENDYKITKELNALTDNRSNRQKRKELTERKKMNYETILNHFEVALEKNSADDNLKKIIQDLKSYIQQ